MSSEARRRRVDRLRSWLYPDGMYDIAVFAAEVQKRLRPGQRVLDLGAGSGRVKLYDWRGQGREVIGIDLDPRVGFNPKVSFGVIGNGVLLPFADNSFDLCVSTAVLEHLQEPNRVFAEVSRVLRPGGSLLAITPNVFSYHATFARLTPHWIHELVTGNKDETFPTLYRANSIGTISHLGLQSGLTLSNYRRYMGPPGYFLTRNWLLFLLAHVAHRFIDVFLPACRQVIMVHLTKPGSATPDASLAGARSLPRRSLVRMSKRAG